MSVQKVLVFGAGRSSWFFINYMAQYCQKHNILLTVVDQSVQHVAQWPSITALSIDIHDEVTRRSLVNDHDLVVSLLPVAFHTFVIQDCLALGKHFANASYASDELKQLNEAAKQAGLMFACEMGLDPGLDHMSALSLIHDLQAQGATLKSFTSYTGGLVSPSADTNSWHYKISWNPKNVVLAGKSGAQFLEDNQLKSLPYHRLFRSCKSISVNGVNYQGYANRDSTIYESLYGLQGIETLIRGTLRQDPYCDGWDALVQLGWTDDVNLVDTNRYSWLEITLGMLGQKEIPFEGFHVNNRFYPQSIWDMMAELGLASAENANQAKMTPAALLETLMVAAWKLMDGDKDLIIMQHEFVYQKQGNTYKHTSTLSLEGDDDRHTAMAKLVGWPLAIFCKNFMEGKVKHTGLVLPLTADIYKDILDELEDMGVVFHEIEELITQ